MLKIKTNYRLWVKLTLIYFFVQFVVRTFLVIDNPPSFTELIAVYANGFLWDSFAWIFMSFPLLIISLLFKDATHEKFLKSRTQNFFIFFLTLLFSFIGLSEMFFWNEFHSRFNFIAVDYLIYTNEVFSNLRESFDLRTFLGGVLVFALFTTWASNYIAMKPWERKPFLRKRITLSLFGFVLPAIFSLGIGPWLEMHDENFHDDQLSRNGVVEFFRAFRSNKIDYRAFYATLPEEKVEKIYESKNLTNEKLSFGISSRPNIIFIAVESLGAKFIRTLGKEENLTPYLNQLSDKSLFFTNFYATGTRTVRGLEALTLSVPPTPGYAVVKRPDHGGLFSMGHTFKQNGYDPYFLYGGNGFFDNMNAFFSSNSFQIVDQTDFSKNEITFSNAWGVCDEDLFAKAEKLIEARKDKNPFLFFMLTTSNHRPFTYPKGKIDIASGTSRAGAVKYTDYAIGTFLKRAAEKEWAKNTIFVIVADHSTEGRGQFALELNDFHIPLWIYSPKLIKPMKVKRLASQIDLLPTLIHLLNLKDDSPFFGRSIFNPSFEERAFVGNYQYVGYYKDHTLTTLGPNRVIRNFSYDPSLKTQTETNDSPFVNEAISYYQLASRKLDTGGYKVQK